METLESETPTAVHTPEKPESPPPAPPRGDDVLAERRARQHDEFGGLDWPAAFFGWPVAIGLATMLVAVLAAAGTALGITEMATPGTAPAAADSIGVAGG